MYVPGMEPGVLPREQGGGSTPWTWFPTSPTGAMSWGASAVTGVAWLSWSRPVKSMPQSASFHVV